jgi:hypothetical protein
MSAKDEAFVMAFKRYVRWVADNQPLVTEGQSHPRAAMLESFQAFLTDSDIKPDKPVHFELVAKMTEFAKGAPGGGPR